ncbi:MAG: AI-2E family transporter [Candidatus Magasanikbacteria bacterium]|nr:AI-2E family transporter [Candidatus Magasanikbacteria bacterium]
MPKTKVNFDKMRSAFFFALIILLSIGMVYLLRPFFYPIFWAAIVAVIFYPIYRFTNKYLNSPGTSSIITIILFTVFLLLPLTLFSVLFINESVNLFDKISQRDVLGDVKIAADWINKTSLAPYVEIAQEKWTGYALNASETVVVFLFTNIKNITQNSMRFIVMFFLMLYTLYYFFKDGEKMLKRIVEISPLGNKYEKLLYKKFTSTTKATLKGTLIIGGIQGLIGGLTFWVVGIEGAFIWGVIMLVMSLIPAIGPFLIWFPAVIILLLTGNIWQGVVLLLVGSLFISSIDNLLRPIIVGKDTGLHPLIVLLSTLGGLLIFGISGFIIGPVIAALFLSIITIYKEYYKKELKNN